MVDMELRHIYGIWSINLANLIIGSSGDPLLGRVLFLATGSLTCPTKLVTVTLWCFSYAITKIVCV